MVTTTYKIIQDDSAIYMKRKIIHCGNPDVYMQGKTPLIWASRKGHKENVEALIEKGIDVDEKENHGRLLDQEFGCRFGPTR